MVKKRKINHEKYDEVEKALMKKYKDINLEKN